jgi:hypothetical protein
MKHSFHSFVGTCTALHVPSLLCRVIASPNMLTAADQMAHSCQAPHASQPSHAVDKLSFHSTEHCPTWEPRNVSQHPLVSVLGAPELQQDKPSRCPLAVACGYWLCQLSKRLVVVLLLFESRLIYCSRVLCRVSAKTGKAFEIPYLQWRLVGKHE